MATSDETVALESIPFAVSLMSGAVSGSLRSKHLRVVARQCNRKILLILVAYIRWCIEDYFHCNTIQSQRVLHVILCLGCPGRLQRMLNYVRIHVARRLQVQPWMCHYFLSTRSKPDFKLLEASGMLGVFASFPCVSIILIGGCWCSDNCVRVQPQKIATQPDNVYMLSTYVIRITCLFPGFKGIYNGILVAFIGGVPGAALFFSA